VTRSGFVGFLRLSLVYIGFFMSRSGFFVENKLATLR